MWFKFVPPALCVKLRRPFVCCSRRCFTGVLNTRCLWNSNSVGRDTCCAAMTHSSVGDDDLRFAPLDVTVRLMNAASPW